ncbi:MAG: hypothetical protein HY201_00540 [Nitrospirae bacterium]|nr:hypothetical protein [Candidatus Troglogloeales bacterium]
MKTSFKIVILLALLVPSFVQADEIPLFYEGIRPLGMGGAFTAVADDGNAIFYNPAGLNQIKGFGRFDIINLTVELNKNALDLIKDAKEISDISDPNENSDKAIDLINKNIGERFHLKAALFPHIVFHNFGFGILAQGVLNGAIHNPLASNTLEVRGTADLAVMTAGAYRFKVKGRPLILGLTAKAINRNKLDKETYTTREIIDGEFKIQKELNPENGFALDVGALYPIPIFLNPTVGLSLQNIVGGDLGDAGKLPPQVNLGVALRPEIGFGKVVIAADWVDVAQQVGTDKDIAKRLHAGVEYQFPVILTLRAGLAQGYPSFGTTFSLWLVRFSYAYYISEIGAFAGQQPDPRHVVQLSVGF